MSVWDAYRSRVSAAGGDSRGAVLQRERRFLNAKLPKSLSYHSAVINGEPRNLAIINTDNLDTKTLCSLPGEDLPHGGMVEWMDSHWLITDKDANNEVYTKAIMRQCNYLLRWIAKDGNIIERWCVIEDGTKYLTGELGDNHFVVTRGDSRIAITISKDKYTLEMGREDRFLIDDYASDGVMAYRLTKPFKLGRSYGDDGVVCFVLAECNTEDDDNLELHIADYYKYFPRPNDESSEEEVEVVPGESTNEHGKKVWL